MTQEYSLPEIWNDDSKNEGVWAGINKPDSGARHEKALPVGDNPLQLYSMATPNGQKVTIMLEELLALGVSEAQYDAHLIKIGDGEQFSSGFVNVNPNSKIPALVDCSGDVPIKVFESGSILFYLAEKYEYFLPTQITARTDVINWLFWLQGAAPSLGGGFGHFYAYAPEKLEYPINRFTMEAKRQLDVLDKQLAKNTYIAGDEYSIADIAIWPWYGALVLGQLYNAGTFLNVSAYPNLQRWAKNISMREAVKRGRIVNRAWGEVWEILENRHRAQDIDEVLAKKS